MIPAIERNYPQGEIAGASYEYQSAVERGENVIVGVNKFVERDEQSIELLQIDRSVESKQVERLAQMKAQRHNGAVKKTLDDLRRAAAGSESTMPFILSAVRAYATVGEICTALADVFGRYSETSVL